MLENNNLDSVARLRFARVRRMAPCILFVLSVSAGGPPPIPAPPADAATVYEVQRITSDGCLVLGAGQTECTVTLADVKAPRNEAARSRARYFLTQLLLGERVRFGVTAGTKDAPLAAPISGRLFRMPDGLYVNLEIVRQGYAAADAAPASKEGELLRYYEGVARRYQKGIWAPAEPGAKPAAGEDAGEQAPSVKADSNQIVVYITKSGEKYHREGCQHLRKSARSIPLSEAVEKGYEPCKRCKPPTLADPDP